MTRKFIATLAIVLTGGIVVAVVRAQESPSNNVYSSQRSVLKRSTEADSDDSDSQSSRLADRLKRIRNNTVGDGRDSTSATLSAPPRRTVHSPAGGDPTPRPISGDGPVEDKQEPKLLATPRASDQGTPAGVFADRGSARRPRARRMLSPPAASVFDNSEPGELTAPVEEPLDRPFSPVETPMFQETRQVAEPVRNALITSVGPALQVDTFGPRAIVINREAEFKISLTNQSDFPAHDVFIRVALPNWVDVVAAEGTIGDTQIQTSNGAAQELIWRVSQFAANAQEVLNLNLTPRENRSFNLAVDWTLRPLAKSSPIEVQQPELQMALVGPREIRYGESAIYSIKISNPGTGDAENVELNFAYGAERLPTKRVGNLAAGDQTEVSVELTARQAGALRVEASATAAGGLSIESQEQVWVRRAKLEVDVAGSEVKYAGSLAQYDFRVRNVGDAPADNVVAEIQLPPGAKLASQQPLNGQPLVKELGSISPESERTFRVQCQLTNPGENVVEARAKAAGNLAAGQSFVTHVHTIADLKLTVNDPPGPISIGQDTVYDLTIVNRGSRAAQNVKIVAQFSEGVEPVNAAGVASKLIPGQVLFQPVARIEPGEELRLKITARASSAGNHRFRAEVRCSEPPDTLLVEEETTYFFGKELSTARSSRVTR